MARDPITTRILQLASVLARQQADLRAEAFTASSAGELAEKLQAACVALDIPLPPPGHLQERVLGVYPPAFMTGGIRAMTEFNLVLARCFGTSLAEYPRILDFGVGCGRILRIVAEAHPFLQLTGVDIDAEAIEWLRANYGRYGKFAVAPDLPPLDLPTETFDLIFSISVFTHLPEEMQFAWLAELQRLTAPGGVLLLTVHGENHLQAFPQERQAEARKAGGFLYNDEARLTDGLPAFYKNAYHTERYIRSRWSEFFEIVACIPLGNEKHQDIVVCRKRATSAKRPGQRIVRWLRRR